MGNGSSKSHQSYAVAPTVEEGAAVATATAEPVEVPTMAEGDLYTDTAGTLHVFSHGATVAFEPFAGGVGGGLFKPAWGVADIAEPSTSGSIYGAPLASPAQVGQQDQVEAEVAAAKAQWLAALNNEDLSLDEKFAALKLFGDTTRGLIYDHDELHPTFVNEKTNELRALTGAYLQSLTAEQLQHLATGEGFQYPMLVGIGKDTGKDNALVFWLDPAYAPGSVPKSKIQAAALKRFNQLASGEVDDIGGLTLADVMAASEVKTEPGQWTATYDELVAIREELKGINVENHNLYYGDPKLVHVADLERQVLTARVPGMGAEELQAFKSSVSNDIDKALETTYPYAMSMDLKKSKDELFAHGLTENQVYLLGPQDTLALLRASTSQSQREALVQQADERRAEMDKLIALTDPYAEAKAVIKDGTGLSTGPEREAFLKHLEVVASYRAIRKEMDWYGQAGAPGLPGVSLPMIITWKSPESSYFRNWAKKVSIQDLRATAYAAGLQDPDTAATRSQLQNYLVATWDGSFDKAALQTEVLGQKAASAAKKAEAKANKAATAAYVPPVAAPAPAPVPSTPAAKSAAAPAPAVAMVPTVGKWKIAVGQIAQALKKAAGAHVDVPKWASDSEIASLSFAPATKAPHLGGLHTKAVLQAPDGTLYLKKPDTGRTGVKALSEVVASRIVAGTGVHRAVPCYVRREGAEISCIQPIIKDAPTLEGDLLTNWSDADVTTIVGQHACDWLLGDHDGNLGNWIRTPHDGLVRIDYGQAFRFWGKDKLSMDYDPNGGTDYTSCFQRLMKAHKSGTKTLTAAHTARLATMIDYFEKMPDSVWRAKIAEVAEKGSKTKGDAIWWVPEMRKRAAKKLAKPESEVKPAEIAEAFLDFGCERKHNLRADFVKVLNQAGVPHSLA